MIRTTYHSKLSSEHQKQVVEAESECSVFSALEKWLGTRTFVEISERTPFLEDSAESYNFLESYKRAGEEMYAHDQKVMKFPRIVSDISMIFTQKDHRKEYKRFFSRRERNPIEASWREQEQLQGKEFSANFQALFDEKAHEEKIVGGTMRFSFKAMQAALLIHIYQDEPIFSLPWM